MSSELSPKELQKPHLPAVVKNKKYYLKKLGIPVLFALIAMLIVFAISIIIKHAGGG